MNIAIRSTRLMSANTPFQGLYGIVFVPPTHRPSMYISELILYSSSFKTLTQLFVIDF